MSILWLLGNVKSFSCVYAEYMGLCVFRMSGSYSMDKSAVVVTLAVAGMTVRFASDTDKAPIYDR